jgi:hypothetical protein
MLPLSEREAESLSCSDRRFGFDDDEAFGDEFANDAAVVCVGDASFPPLAPLPVISPRELDLRRALILSNDVPSMREEEALELDDVNAPGEGLVAVVVVELLGSEEEMRLPDEPVGDGCCCCVAV